METDSLIVKKYDYDKILDEVGFGKYHLFLFTLVGMFGIVDGSESTTNSFLLNIFRNKFRLSDLETSAFGTCLYLSSFIGILISGFVTDRFGRLRPIQISCIIQILSILISSQATDFYTYLFFRCIFMANYNFVLPSGYVLLAENLPIKTQQVTLIFIGIFYAFGPMMSCLLAKQFLDQNLDDGDWKYMSAFPLIPVSFFFILSLILLKESQRFTLQQGKIHQAIKDINYMSRINNSRVKLQEDNIDHYEIIQQSESKKVSEHKLEIGDLLKQPLIFYTLSVWFVWYSTSFVFYGIDYIFIITLKALHIEEKNQDTLQSILNASFTQLFVPFTCYFIQYFMKSKVQSNVMFGQIFSMLGCMAIYFRLYPGFIIYNFATKFSGQLLFTFLYPFTVTIYPTNIRATSLGLANAFSSFGGLTMPWIGIYFGKVGVMYPYLFYGMILFIALILIGVQKFQRYKD